MDCAALCRKSVVDGSPHNSYGLSTIISSMYMMSYYYDHEGRQLKKDM